MIEIHIKKIKLNNHLEVVLWKIKIVFMVRVLRFEVVIALELGNLRKKLTGFTSHLILFEKSMEIKKSLKDFLQGFSK